MACRAEFESSDCQGAVRPLRWPRPASTGIGAGCPHGRRGERTEGQRESQSILLRKLRQYIVQLAAAKEEQFKVMNQEAQRCRLMLSRQPPEKNSTENRTESK